MSEEEVEGLSLEDDRKNFKKLMKRFYYVVIVLVIIVAVLGGYIVAEVETFKADPCQYCEDEFGYSCISLEEGVVGIPALDIPTNLPPS